MSLDSGISGQGGAGATDRIALPRRAVRRKNGDDRRIHGRNLPARNRPSRRNSLHRPDGRSPHAGRVVSPRRSDQFAEVFQIARGRGHGRDGHVVAQDAADFQPAVGGTSGRNVRAASEARSARRPPHPRQAPVHPGRGGRCARDSVLQCGRQHRRGSVRDHDRSPRKKVPSATHSGAADGMASGKNGSCYSISIRTASVATVCP